MELLSASETLKILTTSRMALRVSGEHEYDVPSLELPPRVPPGDEDALARLSKSEAVRLFVERARAGPGGFCSLTRQRAGRGGDLPSSGRLAVGY